MFRTASKLAGAFAFLAYFAATISGANAIPLLQVYGENPDGSGADHPGLTDDSWLVTAQPGDTIRIWAIANLEGGGGKGPLTDAHLLITFDGSGPTQADLQFTGTQVGGTGSFAVDGNTYTDPSAPSNAAATSAPSATVPTFTSSSGRTFCLGGGCDDNMNGHDPINKAGTTSIAIKIDDFLVADTPLGDFNADDGSGGTVTDFSGDGTAVGAIHAFDFTVPAGGVSDWHFDVVAFCAGCGNPRTGQWKQNPGSHDLDGTSTTTTRVSEPGMLALFGISLLGLGLVRRRKLA